MSTGLLVKLLWLRELVTPLIVDQLRPAPISLALIDLLADIGPPAAAAIPRLQSIVDSEERFMKWGSTLDVGLLDEAFVDRSSKAILSIQSVD